ncbi:PepSY-associated TM helix domain-containing protein [Cupriavidus sp. 30B13]|uniref:PepSY-associated TM helix domain-containing protein n=1 Tax=Cupriavidus sp. 30B13 TaxID=3384241 RepID=UPI003B9124D1
MKENFRQSMAWLHTWCGLWLGWLLFAVFLCGALSVFHAPVTRWMQPERLMVSDGAFDPDIALAHAQETLEHEAPDAASWRIEFPSAEDRAMHLHWDGQEGGELRLDPITGAALPPARDTEGGHHFIEFHYELHAGMAGVWIVAFATMAMLVALVSGIVTHRRFFKDFFTFRPGKGQRSWLDAHNALGVLTLPFLFLISYTGLIIWWPDTMPAGIDVHYNGDQRAFFDDVGRGGWLQPKAVAPAGDPAPLAPLPALLADARARLATGTGAGGAQADHRTVATVMVERPGRTTASVIVAGPYRFDGVAFAAAREFRYDGVTGAYLSTHANDEMLGEGANPALVAGSVLRTLHMARFGGDTVKWLYFVCGLAGAAMIAAGLLLFSVKRASRKAREFGAASARVYEVIERLNVAAIAGLLLACIVYLWGNRLLPLGLVERHHDEAGVFFAAWLAATVHALASAPARAWPAQLGTAGLLCLALPILNAATTGWHLARYLTHGDWQAASVELAVLVAGMLMLWAALRLRRRPAAIRTGARQDGKSGKADEPAGLGALGTRGEAR